MSRHKAADRWFRLPGREGIAESTALISKVFSGALSDYLGRREGLAVLGCALDALAKPGVGVIVAAGFIDRVGKGICGAPRDALVADITPAAIRRAGFGLRQSLDTVEASVGPLLATVPILLWANDFNLLSGLAMLASSAITGLLWQSLGPAFTFHVGAGFAALAMAVLAARSPRNAGARRLAARSLTE